MPKRISNPIGAAEQMLSVWLEHYENSEIGRQAEILPLRRDMETLLTFVRDNKVVGTQGAGNMPMKAVREVTARFANPPKLEDTIGKEVFRIRSEADLWPLYFLRVLAEVGGLLKPGSTLAAHTQRRGFYQRSSDAAIGVLANDMVAQGQLADRLFFYRHGRCSAKVLHSLHP